MKATLMSFFICVCTLLTGLIYANWQDNSFENEMFEMSNYSQYTVSEVLVAPEGKTLVPDGAILGINDVTKIDFSYEILIEEGYTLSVFVQNILLTRDNQITDGFDFFDFDFVIQQNDDFAVVDISISLRMPESRAEYDLVAGSQVSFDLLFSQEQI